MYEQLCQLIGVVHAEADVDGGPVGLGAGAGGEPGPRIPEIRPHMGQFRSHILYVQKVFILI